MRTSILRFIIQHRSVLTMLALGLSAGVLGGLLGIGGGTLVVPGLVFFFGFNQHRAHGTSLLIALILASAGVITYYSKGNVNLVIALEIAIGGVFGAAIGAKAAGAMRGRTLRIIFSLFLIFIGVRMVVAGFQAGQGIQYVPLHIMSEPVFGTALVLVLGVLTGFLSALLGIGGGMVMIPALVILLGVPQKTAHGISLAAMIPTAFTGMLLHSRMGNVVFKVGKWVGIGAAAGAVIGAAIAVSLQAEMLRLVFGVFLLIMSILMVKKR